VPNGDISSADIFFVSRNRHYRNSGDRRCEPAPFMLLEKQKKGPLQAQLMSSGCMLSTSRAARKNSAVQSPFPPPSRAGNGAIGGVLNFDPKWQLNRAGLLLQNGVVYVAFGSHGDNGPWHGWILSYDATTLSRISAYCSTPNGFGSGVWMAGTGLAADVIDSVNNLMGGCSSLRAMVRLTPRRLTPTR